MKLVSVMILSYRNLSRVFPTLDSLLTQDYPALELVFSDDASPDYAEWKPRVEEYLEKRRTEAIREIIWVSHGENVGTVRNSNDAIRASHGEYVFSIAPEDEFAHPGALGELVRCLEETGKGVCFGRLQGVTPDGRTVDHLLSCESDYDLLKSYTMEQTRNRLFSRNFLPAPAVMLKRDVFEKNGYYPESIRLIEDYPYWLILTSNGVAFAYLDEVVVRYGLSGVSSSGHYGEAFMEDMFRIYDQFIFPFDRRFGPLQGAYNLLKRHGLQYYRTLARWPKLSAGKRAWYRVRYAPFFLYTGMLDWKTALVNRRERPAGGHGGGTDERS